MIRGSAKNSRAVKDTPVIWANSLDSLLCAYRPQHEDIGFALRFLSPARDTAPGYVFVALKNGAVQHGPVIIDDLGRLLWFNKNRSVRDFRVQRYGDRPVLTWWEGVQE
jgi:hypothetical protein